MLSDLDTGGFSYGFSREKVVAIAYENCDLGYARLRNVSSKTLVARLLDAVDSTNFQPNAHDIPRIGRRSTKSGDQDSDVITHKWLWQRTSSWFKEGGLIVTDTGTSYVGYCEMTLPRNAFVINQILWSSIGYGVGAAQGAALAAKDEGKGRRTICFEGDGMSSYYLMNRTVC